MDLRNISNKLVKFFMILISIGLVLYFVILEAIVLFEAGFLNIVSSVKNIEILSALSLSIITASISSLLSMLLIIPLGYFNIKCSRRTNTIVEGVFSSINSVPPIVLGLSILILFGKHYLGGFTDYLGIEILFTKFAIVIAQVAVVLPMGYIEFVNYLRSVDERYILTARGYGADDLFIYRRIIIPEVFQGIKSTSILMWSKAIGHFGAVVMVVGVTRFKTEVLPSTVFLNISCGDLEKSLAAAGIMIIISNIISIIMLKGRKEK